MLAIHFGAGNIGRGFIAPLLTQSGYDVVFVDVNETIINALKMRETYTVKIADASGETFEVKHAGALNSLNEADEVVSLIGKAGLITTAVGPSILERIAPLVAQGLKTRLDSDAPLNIIACENMINGTSHFKEHILAQFSDKEKAIVEAKVGFPNSAVDRIIPLQSHEDPLYVEVEPFYEWVINQKEIQGELPKIEGVTYVDDLLPYIERKLFTLNTGHAAAAYIGNSFGIATIKDAIEDERVRPLVEGVLKETGELLQRKHGFDKDVHENYKNKILSRFENDYIVDEVSRVGRSPLRKISANERFVKPATELLKYGVKPTYLSRAMGALMKYKNNEDPEAVELQDYLATHSVRDALHKYAKLEENDQLALMIEQEV